LSIAQPVGGTGGVNNVQWRALILTALFAAASGLLVGVNAPQVEATPRYALDDATYTVPGWTASRASVDGRPGVVFVTRVYVAPDGAQARLTITTSPQAKLVYRASADVPFLGNGYTIEAVPAEVVSPRPDRTAQIARRGGEAWLQIAAFGERRGVLGNGPAGWSLAVFDMLLGHANDYYLSRVLVPYAESASAANAVALADTLFPRLAAFYAAA
jgi:hypothetical protein